MKGGGHVIMRRTKREGREVWRGGGGQSSIDMYNNDVGQKSAINL
jgi:hypothetical protein